MARAPATSVRRRSPTWAVSPGDTPRYPSACSKIWRAGLYQPTSSEKDQPLKHPEEPEALQDPPEARGGSEADVAHDAHGDAALVQTPDQLVHPVAQPEPGVLAHGHEPLDQPRPRGLVDRALEEVDRGVRRLLAGVLLVPEPSRLMLLPHGTEGLAEDPVVHRVADGRVTPRSTPRRR